jgi:hypothetical protein
MNYYAQGGQVMPASQIILNDPQNEGEDLDAIIRFYADLNEQGRLWILQENNTILVLISLGDNVVEAHLYTLDAPIAMAHSLQKIVDELKNSHIKKVYSHMSDDTPKILRLIQSFGLKPQKSDNPDYDWMTDV